MRKATVFVILLLICIPMVATTPMASAERPEQPWPDDVGHPDAGNEYIGGKDGEDPSGHPWD